jgi:molybdopterin converting factor small subunit
MSGNNRVTIEVFGALAGYAGTRMLTINLPEPIPLKTLLEELETGLPEDFGLAIQKRSTILVLVNEREISVLDGMNTEVSPGDKVVLLPVSHGGSR